MFRKLGDEYRTNGATAPGPAVTDTIEEDADAEEAQSLQAVPWASGSSGPDKRLSNPRLSRLSNDARVSAYSTDSGPRGDPNSNRSSLLTIKAAESPRNSTRLEEFDFDKALVKFAAERESFLSDLSLSAGAITTPRPASKLRTQKIVSEDVPSQPAGLLRSGIGSVRRHMAFRDMNSMKRQPSVARQGE